MTEDLRALVEVARRAARAASVIILDIYTTQFAVRKKDDASPVTEADERAEHLIVAALAKEAPYIPVIAEELVAANGAPSTLPRRFWLVDPLDGTKEFIARNGEFSINIGLVEGDRPVLGVVHVPVANVTYAAAGPGTATRQAGDAAPVAIAARPVPASGAVIVHSRSHGDSDRFAAYRATIAGARTKVSGSAVKFCLVAEGTADLYPRFGPTMEWDTCAGHAVLEGAGGSVLTPDGAPFRYAKPGFLNGEFIAKGKS